MEQDIGCHDDLKLSLQKASDLKELIAEFPGDANDDGPRQASWWMRDTPPRSAEGSPLPAALVLRLRFRLVAAGQQGSRQPSCVPACLSAEGRAIWPLPKSFWNLTAGAQELFVAFNPPVAAAGTFGFGKACRSRSATSSATSSATASRPRPLGVTCDVQQVWAKSPIFRVSEV